MAGSINEYTIQRWLFDEAEGKFDIDLAESGIQYHHLHDLDLSTNHDLNYSLDRGQQKSRELVAKMYGVAVDRVVITHGSQEALYLYYRSVLKPGDHVITFSPGWQQSWEVPKVVGCDVTVVPLSADKLYQLDLSDVEKALRKNTKLIIINNPCNPTGVSVNQSFFTNLIALLDQRDLSAANVICDEEYFTDYKKSAAHVSNRIAVTSSLSKVYGFPGLRFGWLIADKKMIDEVVNYKRYVSVSNSTLCEYLAWQVLENYHVYTDYYHELIQQGINTIAGWVENFEQMHMVAPQGTSFVYLTLSDKTLNSFELARRCLQESRTLVMPAEVFEDKNAIRVSIGRPEQILKQGLENIGKSLTSK